MGIIVETLPDGRSWRLKRGFKYKGIHIPRGFVFDFASIPKLFWSLVGSPATGKHRLCAIPHDYIYYKQHYTRKFADKLFAECLKDKGVSWWKRTMMYWAVRIFGRIGWNRRKKELS
jgi:hypothetical protein